MKTLTVHIHPLALAAIVALAVPTIAIAAGTILAPPVTVTGSGALTLLTATNGGSGTAISATSLKGNAIHASAKGNALNAVTTNQSASTHTQSAAVAGYDGATDTGSLNSGVYGQSKYGIGLSGASTNSIGVQARSTNGVGVSASSTNNTGLDAISTNSLGLDVKSTNYIGANVVGGTYDTVNQDYLPALSIVANGSNQDLIDACPAGPAHPCEFQFEVFNVQPDGSANFQGSVYSLGINTGNITTGYLSSAPYGDVDIVGQYLKNGSCVAGCALPTKSSPGRTVASYASQETSPTIEDFGEAQLVSGEANVRLGADFANVIDAHWKYMVFITPEGPNRGLYVTNKTAAGFEVSENPGGHSTIAFSYRIVAKRFGEDSSPRLPRLITSPRASRFRNRSH
jgi:hypothetical protein